MMRQQTISAPEFERGRRRDVQVASRRRRLVLIAVLLSVGIHATAALLIVLLPRIQPKEAQPQEQGTVELLMVEQKGAAPSQGGQPKESQPAPPQKAEAPPKAPDPAKVEDQKDQAQVPKTAFAPPVVTPGDEPAPPPVEQTQPKPDKAEAQPNPQPPSKQAQPEAVAQQPTPPPSQQAPVFDLAGTESESNAIVLGGQVLPAMKDDRFRNRPPIYPVEAELHNQHGSVSLVIHVAANGLAAGVDILESSGVESLDQSAIAAASKWHFRPALREGQPVPFDMPFRFIFEADDRRER